MTDWTHHRKYIPPADPASLKQAQSIYGPVYRMLVIGGQRDLNGPERIYRDPKGRPRKPQRFEGYPGEVTYEPDPNLSDLKTTWALVCHMVRRGWTSVQIQGALLNPAHAGGEFFRFEVLTSKDGGERFLTYMIDGSYPVSSSSSAPATDASSPYSPSSGKAIGGRGSTGTEQSGTSEQQTRKAGRGDKEQDEVETWRVSTKGFPLRQREAERMVQHIARADEAIRTTNALNEGGPLHRRVAGSYLKMLEERAIITRSEKVVQTAGGKRTCMVVEIADRGPLDLADRRLWKLGQDASLTPWAEPLGIEQLYALIEPSGAEKVEITKADLDRLIPCRSVGARVPWRRVV